MQFRTEGLDYCTFTVRQHSCSKVDIFSTDSCGGGVFRGVINPPDCFEGAIDVN